MIIAGTVQAHRKRESSLHLLLHSSWVADVLQLVTSARKVYKLIGVAAWMGFKSGGGLNLSTLCVKRRMWWNAYFLYETFYVPSRPCMKSLVLREVLSACAKLLLSGVGLNWGQGKFGPQCWFIFAGTRTLLGTTGHLLVFHWQGFSQRGTVSGDFFPLAMAPAQSKSPVHIYKERLPVSVWLLCENTRE